jgi:opacity protein-like surface antigen
MNSTSAVFSHTRKFGGLLALIVALVLLLPALAAAQMISDGCAVCHNEKYQNWKASGHPYKLMDADRAQNRPIPLPEEHTWDEISYVIGGYKWKSRYMDANGYIITQGIEQGKPEAGGTQYNYLTGEWADYHADELDGTKPYDCGQCHTTGWVADEDAATDGDLSDNQGGLPGIWGTFEDGGIQCKACHTIAEGESHPAFDGSAVDPSADACGACHYRTAAPGDTNLIPASGGWIRHHEQYNEHLAGPHGSQDCVMCHDPHKRGEYSIWEEGAEGHEDGAVCGVSCHSSRMESFMESSMYDYGVTCNDCHMPFASKSAAALGPNQGDVRTHIFYINTDPVDRSAMFTEDGSEVLLDSEGKASVTLDFVCQRCHETASLEELSKFAKGFHDPDIGLQNVGLNPGLTGTWWGGEDRSGEGFLLEFAYAGDVLYFFGSFYTYDNAGNLVWLTFEPSTGVPASGTTMDVSVFITEGARWGSDFNPSDVVRAPFGSGTFSFDTCTTGNVAILPNQDFQNAGFTNMSYDLSRLLEAGVSCPTFDNTSGTTVAAQ